MIDTVYKLFNTETGRYYDPKDTTSVTGKIYRSIKNVKTAKTYANKSVFESDKFEIHEFKINDYLVIK